MFTLHRMVQMNLHWKLKCSLIPTTHHDICQKAYNNTTISGVKSSWASIYRQIKQMLFLTCTLAEGTTHKTMEWNHMYV